MYACMWERQGWRETGIDKSSSASSFASIKAFQYDNIKLKSTLFVLSGLYVSFLVRNEITGSYIPLNPFKHSAELKPI